MKVITHLNVLIKLIFHSLRVKQSVRQWDTFLTCPVGSCCRHQYLMKHICDFNTLCKDKGISA